jgi:adenylate kinase
MEQKSLIEQIAQEGAQQTVQALALAQQMGMVTSQEELTVLIASGMETVLEEYIERIENQSKIIIDETGSI